MALPPLTFTPPPTLLSTFEVLFTQQFPRIAATAPFQGANDYAIKGYFLTIANPNPKQYVFDVGFHCNPPGVGDRGLTATSPFLDSNVPGVQPTFSGATVDGSLRVTVSARGTILVGLLPTIFGSAPPKSDIDIRGWVDLSLPALRGNIPLFYQPQSSTPIPVIVTAEQRITFLTPASGEALTGDPVLASTIDFKSVEAQAAFTLPLATGAASFSVPPQPGFSIFTGNTGNLEATDAETIDAMVQRSPATMARLFGKLTEDVKELT